MGGVGFDDEPTAVQVRAPLLERVNDRKQLALVHRIIYFGSGELSRSKSHGAWSILTFLLQDSANANVTCVSRYDIRLVRIRQL
jgi:hypothetical protein